MGLRRDRRVRAAVDVAAGVAVLALAPTASAAFKPLFTATSSGNVVTLSYSQPAANDGTAALAFYAPKSYVPKLSTKAGTVVGTATGNAVAADIRGATMPLDGTIRVASPTAPLGRRRRRRRGDLRGPGQVRRRLEPDADGFNQSIPLAIGVQKLDSGPMAGGIAFFVCPPAADLPAGHCGPLAARA